MCAAATRPTRKPCSRRRASPTARTARTTTTGFYCGVGGNHRGGMALDVSRPDGCGVDVTSLNPRADPPCGCSPLSVTSLLAATQECGCGLAPGVLARVTP